MGGPNAGIFYVSGVNFRMDRATGMNAEITPSGRLRMLPPGPQADECRQKMGLPPGAAVWVNFYTFNTQCKNHDLSGFHAGVWTHEAFGTTGTNGHESQGRMAASEARNDMHALIEDMSDGDDVELRLQVRERLRTPQDEVDARGKAHGPVTNNWTGNFWIWHYDAQAYILHEIFTI